MKDFLPISATRLWVRQTRSGTLRWQGNSDVRVLRNKPVRIQFHLVEASLYAFQFVTEERM